MNFAKSNATINITPILNANSFLNAQAVPKEVINSMEIQGLTQNSPYSPGMPINPVNTIGTEPRQFEYMIGQNIVQRPRSTESMSFSTMRQLIEIYDIAQMCIEVRQDELRNLDWDIVPKDENDKNATVKYANEIKTIKAFFEKPDGYTLFDDFQNQLAYDWMAFDSLTIYPHLTKGGQLGALEVLDGTLITPQVDYYGRIPNAPAPAFLQWAYGMPWTWLNKDQLIYVPHRKKTNKLYGSPAIEWLLNNINTDIRYQLYFLQYFTEGSVPASWGETPETWTASQIKEFQTMFDDVMAGDQIQKQRVKWVPHGANMKETKNLKFDIAFPQFLLNKTCAAYKVAPAELGFTEKVNKSSGETQENMQYRRSIKPSAKYFQNIYTGIINTYFKLPNLKFKFLNVEEQEDQLVMAQRDQIYINAGVLSPDEIRVKRLGLEIDTGNPVPRLFVAGTAVMPVSDIIAQSKANIDQIADKASTTAEKVTKDFFINPTRNKKSNLNLKTK